MTARGVTAVAVVIALGCGITQADWYQQGKLKASDAASGDWFGISVSIDGDCAIGGACYSDEHGGNSGSAYIFHRIGSTWAVQGKLTAYDAAAGDSFGRCVSISGDFAVVSAPSDDDGGADSGSAYVFHRSGSTWIAQAKITASDAAGGDAFGHSISISGDYVIVGARLDDDSASNSGSAYIFSRTGTMWTQQARLIASDASAGDQFGASVSVMGDYAVAGAYAHDGVGTDSGSAYVFHRVGSTWTEQAKLTAMDAAVFEEFGCSVSIWGDGAIVGAYGDDDAGQNAGSAYVFGRSGTSWTQQAKLTAGDIAAGDVLGLSVCIGAEQAIMGATGGDDGGIDSGSAYVFNMPEPATLLLLVIGSLAMLLRIGRRRR